MPEPAPPLEREIIEISDAHFYGASGRTVALTDDWPPTGWREEGIEIFDRTVHVLGSLGPFVCVRCEDVTWYQDGNMVWQGSSFVIMDLEQQRSSSLTEFLDPSELLRLTEVEDAEVDALFEADENWHRNFDEPETRDGLTMLIPAYTPAGVLQPLYQFTRSAARLLSDGRWSDHTISHRVASAFVPAQLEPFHELPPPVRAWRSSLSSPAERWGWCAVYEGQLDWCRTMFGPSALDP